MFYTCLSLGNKKGCKMSFKVILYTIAIAIGIFCGYYEDKYKKAKIRQKSDCLTEEDKKILKMADFFKFKNPKDFIKKLMPLLMVFCTLLFVGNLVVGFINYISYKEFSSAAEIRELENMDCDDLLEKNLGKEREFCGNIEDDWMWVYKKDLYNSTSKHCCNPIGVSSKLYCSIPIRDTLGKVAEVPNDGIYRFSGTVKRHCWPWAYCVNWITNISPADKKTRERMSR